MFKKLGYGQVEPNRISGIKAGKVLADVPVKAETVEAHGGYIENGMFLAFNAGAGLEGNLKKGELDYPTADSASVGLVYSEVKLYSDLTSTKDFALFTEAPDLYRVSQSPYEQADHSQVSTVIPRVLGLTVNDIFTLNLLADEKVEVGDKLYPNDKGILAKDGEVKQIEATVVQLTTMPDGQQAVKVAITKA